MRRGRQRERKLFRGIGIQSIVHHGISLHHLMNQPISKEYPDVVVLRTYNQLLVAITVQHSTHNSEWQHAVTNMYCHSLHFCPVNVHVELMGEFSHQPGCMKLLHQVFFHVYMCTGIKAVPWDQVT